MPGHRLCAGALLAALALTIVLLGLGHQGAFQVRPEVGRRLAGAVCKGEPSTKQQLRGGILDIICDKIGQPGANFLVFGLGRDSPFWYENTGGKITFLENHADWAKFQNDEVKQRTHFVTYTSEIADYKATLQDEDKLRELLTSLPQDVKDTKWDVILVDSPMGYKMKNVPGRMQSTFAARELAHAGTVIFVDDFERLVEAASATKLLAPFSDKTEVYSNGHGGKTAMFVMARS